MARRNPEPTLRFYINMDEDNLEVHDLDNEKTGENECQIDEIQEGKHLNIPNDKDTLERWLSNNPTYDGCEYCLEEYHVN